MVNPRAFFALSLFSDAGRVKEINEGRSWFSLAELGGISDFLAVPILPTLLQLFVKPMWNPPDWLPVLPIAIENPVDPTAWVGEEGTHPQDPRDDPFYHPDASSYTDKKNGDVLDVREVGISLIWQNVKKAYQISYRTESTLGWPQADVTTVMIPNNPNGKVVSYQMWEDACSLQCAPSYSIVTGVSDPTFDIMLLLGFVVNWPDHQGVNGSYCAGIKEGKSTLDSIRAYLNHKEKIGLGDGYDKIVMWGYSGGSIATGHALETMPTYATDLNGKVIGGLVGGFVVNVTQVVNTINGGIFSGFSAAGVFGLGTEYPSVQQVIEERIRPGIRWRFNSIGKNCIVNQFINFVLQNIWSYTDNEDGKEIMGDPRVYEPLEKEWLGVHAHPTVPVMVYQGVQDEIIDVHTVDGVVDNWCKAGVHVDYYRLGLLEHGGTAVLSILEAIEFVYKLFDGYTSSPCSGYEDATKATTVYYGDKSSPQYSDLVYGKWDQAGLIDKLKQDGYAK